MFIGNHGELHGEVGCLARSLERNKTLHGKTTQQCQLCGHSDPEN